MKNKLKIILIAFIIGAISGCSELERQLVMQKPHMTCDKSESLLICDSEKLEDCYGYIE